ncbi:MAG: hypothetical protein NZM38_00125 [Cytophagales bacterium]|nr:hypothetical protein [Cytophagales bacterium]
MKEVNLSFEEYLASKNIDAQKFCEQDPELFYEWKDLFYQMHPKSFTMQKLYLLNRIRLKYLLKTF